MLKDLVQLRTMLKVYKNSKNIRNSLGAHISIIILGIQCNQIEQNMDNNPLMNFRVTSPILDRF